jgi:hypothetical protein
MIRPEDVTACLVTRGDVDLGPILETLPYPNVIVWGRNREELRVYGRYAAMLEASTPVVYTQDDDCIFRHHDELLAAHQPGRITAVYGHGDNPDGYDDMALVHGGALMDRQLPPIAFTRYLERWPIDEGFYREADMINGIISPHVHVELPYEIRMEIATAPNRMANQPWQRELKLKITTQARLVRDGFFDMPEAVQETLSAPGVTVTETRYA